MKVIVNDANILIDLIGLGLLTNFFELNYEFYTTSLVFEELEDEQQIELQKYVDLEILLVQQMSEEQLVEINNIQKTKTSLSFQDCSAFYQAQIENGILVTSDNTLRKFAKSKNQEVHGHLWIFDKMIESETITGELAIEKLNELCETVNKKLGLLEKECRNRIKQWRQ